MAEREEGFFRRRETERLCTDSPIAYVSGRKGDILRGEARPEAGACRTTRSPESRSRFVLVEWRNLDVTPYPLGTRK